MVCERFLTVVEGHAAVPRDEAERAVHATLETLGERLSKAAVQDLAEQLPDEVVPRLFHDCSGEAFDVDEFLRRVAQREDVDLATAERHARGVFAALRTALTPEELADMRSELPSDVQPIVTGAVVVGADEFVVRVADLGDMTPDAALRATDAVLETLAERLPAGEVDDLRPRLPVELHAALERGRAERNGVVARMPADEFVRRVAEREGVTVECARDHALAVLTALREAVSEEFFDVMVELPHDYDPILPSPPVGTR
jgi:uncharacterized protein (DUF2267 family)